MSSIATAVLKATIGLLLNKCRDKAAENLKEGDVTDQKFRRLIVREIHGIKSKLDELSRNELEASFFFFEDGIVLLYDLFDKRHTARSTIEHSATTQAASAEAFFLTEEMRKLELSGLDESAKRVLSDAKDRFRDARTRATDAFASKALGTVDRILALQYRVMATMLEKIDNPLAALTLCRKCIEDLHGLPAVQKNFNVELTKGLRARLDQDERRKIIADVCHINFFVYSTILMTCLGNKELSNWPCVIMGEDTVDPLRDERVANVLRKLGMEHCCITPWSFGQEGHQVEHKLKNPRGIATNSRRQFIVGDINEVKMFDPTGQFMQHFSLLNDDVETKLDICDVATDSKDNIYLLVQCKKKTGSEEFVVYEFSNTADLHYKFPVRGEYCAKGLTVTNSKVLILRLIVDVYDADGLFVRSFGEGTLKKACDITAANDGRVMVVDSYDSCVHIFTEDGDYLYKFKLQGRYYYPSIAFHQLSKHVVIAGDEREESGVVVEIFTKDGEFVRRTGTEIHEQQFYCVALKCMTVAMDGRIALLLQHIVDKCKVLVI